MAQLAITRRKALSAMGAAALLSAAPPAARAAVPAGFYRPYPEAPSQRNPRFEDMAFLDKDGAIATTRDFRGRVLFLHVWGSWCPPCVREMPVLDKLQARYRGNDRIAFAFVNAGEPIEKSRAFIRSTQLLVDLYDSMAGADDKPRYRAFVNLEGRKRRAYEDYKISVYPTTILLDRNGLYVVQYQTSNKNWLEWIPLLDDVIEGSAAFGAGAMRVEQLKWLDGVWSGEVEAFRNAAGGAGRSVTLRIGADRDGRAMAAGGWSVAGQVPGGPSPLLVHGNEADAYLRLRTEVGGDVRLVARPDGTMTGLHHVPGNRAVTPLQFRRQP